MTESEAKKVAEICTTADNYCNVCAASLIADLCIEFPEHAETFYGAYENEFGRKP